MKISVNAVRTSVRAISLEVRWRRGGALDQRDHLVEERFSQSDRDLDDDAEITVVPPVTPERSPPASRMTGADSPVIAASLTRATTSTTSPSPGMTWFSSTTTMSPSLTSAEGLL